MSKKFILNIKPSKILHTKFGTARIDNKKYYRITSGKEGNNKKLLHRLMFEDFYGRIPEGCNVHHKDGNKLNNCIMNLQMLTHFQHLSLHKTGENHPLYGKPPEDNPFYNKKHKISSRLAMSKAKSTTGYFRVTKHKDKKYKTGFRYRYKYPKNNKIKSISSGDLNTLKKKVLSKGLHWIKL